MPFSISQTRKMKVLKYDCKLFITDVLFKTKIKTYKTRHKYQILSKPVAKKKQI